MLNGLTGLLSYQYARMVNICYGLLYSLEGEEGRCNCEIRNSQFAMLSISGPAIGSEWKY